LLPKVAWRRDRGAHFQEFTMRVHTASIVVLSIALGACGTTTVEPVRAISSRSASTVQKASAVTRPFSGKCELTFNPPPLPLPPVFDQTDTGTCHFSELGKTAYYGEQTINLVAGTQSGWRTFTAANGDILRVEHAGTSAPAGPGLVGFRATLTVVGGTGRFANATGSIVSVGVANLITHATNATFDGSITYNGAARSER
jgi:hypothetical protein